MPAMALLDHNGVYGAARFHTSAKRNKIQAHIGAEVGVSGLGSRLTPPEWLPRQHPQEPARLDEPARSLLSLRSYSIRCHEWPLSKEGAIVLLCVDLCVDLDLIHGECEGRSRAVPAEVTAHTVIHCRQRSTAPRQH
jgi:hypothetical protein